MRTFGPLFDKKMDRVLIKVDIKDGLLGGTGDY
jgi:hypothetical protein